MCIAQLAVFTENRKEYITHYLPAVVCFGTYRAGLKIGDKILAIDGKAGVTIGKGVVVGTGSLVTTDLEDNAIYFGRPARLYKKL